MSNISTRHNIVKFESGKSQAFTGQRLAKVGYKTTKQTKAKFDSVCVSLPKIEEQTILDNSHRLVPYIRNLLETAQDGIIRSLYETSGGLLSSIDDSELSIDSILGFLSAESNGGRLTKEVIADWFVQHVQDNLTVVVAEKLGFQELTETEMDVVNKQLNMFSGLAQSLAAGTTVLSAQQKTGLRKIIDLANDAGQKVSDALTARLDAMDKKELDLAAMLDL
jgi:hypothetical protein